MTRSGVADQPKRSIQIPRPFAFLEENLLCVFRPGKTLRSIFRPGCLALGGLQPAIKAQNAVALERPRDDDPLVPPFQKTA